MWLHTFIPLLAQDIAQKGMFMCHGGVRDVRAEGFNLRVWFGDQRTGRVRIEYRYPADYFLVEATLYVGRRPQASGVQRFTLPRSLLMLSRLGGTGEKQLCRLAACVGDWLREET